MNTISVKEMVSMNTENWMKHFTPTKYRDLLDAQAKRRFAIKKVQRELLAKPR